MGNTSAWNKLLEQNKRIVYKLANKFYIGKSNSIDEEDLIQEGYIGLMIAARKYEFDNPKKAKFMTYAIHWIYSKINRFVQQRNTNDEASLNAFINDDDLELVDTIVDRAFGYDEVVEYLYYQEVRKELELIMDEALTLKERVTIKLNYGWEGECISLDEIASMYEGEDKQRAIVTKNSALAKIRRTPWARREWEYRRRKYDYNY
ncbi:sigma-70 family RNA polymerase sigma factor [Cellulosilyticum sp. I15G10I2]|uniref:sigma-70 family RNA polymerase sigma factor n=1 Tax=Cellulosilyticum sp. I15G10I2 TaxID=1892843 RepID=UPI002100E8EB|nr:sigma-70 family RNA polymerase sigma factor [Cellulosilyticum sp. I15G10I2]